MTGQGRVGVGVIGAGVISSQYLTNLTAFPDVEVRFVADIDEPRAAAQAEAFGVARSGSTADLLADDGIEIVVNLTIPKVHVEVGLDILEAGKNVWSEKPIAMDRESARRLVTAAEESGLRAAVAPDTFLGAGIQSARRYLESGGLGDVKTALSLFQNPGPNAWHPNPDFLFQEGAGPLFDVGVYYVTAMVQFFGPVKRVQATSAKYQDTRVIGEGPRAGQSFDVTVPTHVSALFEYESGQTSQSIFSFDSRLTRTLLEVSGVDGTLVVPDPNMFDGELVVHRDVDDVETYPVTGSTASRGIGVVELARAIRADRPERASAHQGYHVLDIMASTIEAAERGGPVDVESTLEVPPPLPEDWDPAASTLG